MQSPSEILSQINGFFTGKIRRKSSESLTSATSAEEDSSDSGETTNCSAKLRRHSEITNGYRKVRAHKGTAARNSAVNFMRMAKQDIKLNLKRLSFGDNTPPALPARHFSTDGDDLPPPIPERKCSLACVLDLEFERRFTFRSMSTCRLPEPFTDCKKTYPSKQPRRKALQRPATGPPPPPPPQDLSSPSSASPTSPNGVFKLSSPPFKAGFNKPKLNGTTTNNNIENTNNNGPIIEENETISSSLINLNSKPNKTPNGSQNTENEPIKTSTYTDNTYSKTIKTTTKPNPERDSELAVLRMSSGSDIFEEMNGSQCELPELPPSLIPPPPSRPLPPPPPAKPSLIRMNSNQSIVQANRNGASAPLCSFSSDQSSLRSHEKDYDESTRKSCPTSSVSLPPPPLPTRISMTSSLKPKPPMTNGYGSHSYQNSSHSESQENQPISKQDTMTSSSSDQSNKRNKVNGSSSTTSSSSLPKKPPLPPSPLTHNHSRPQLPPKKESLTNGRPLSAVTTNNTNSISSFPPPAFSTYPLPPPPPAPAPPPPPPPLNEPSSFTTLPPPPPQLLESSPNSVSPSSSSSSLYSQRKSSITSNKGSNRYRPLPPPPSEESQAGSKTVRGSVDYGDGWGGKEEFDPREEDGDIYDLMDSTNM